MSIFYYDLPAEGSTGPNTASGVASIGSIKAAGALSAATYIASGSPSIGQISAHGVLGTPGVITASALATLPRIAASGTLSNPIIATGVATIGQISAYGQASPITTYIGGAAGAGYSTGYGASGGGGAAGPGGAGAPGGASQNNATASGGSGGGAAEGGATGQIASGVSGGAGGSSFAGVPGGAGSATGAGSPGAAGSGAGGGSDLGAGATGGSGNDWTLPNGTTVGAGGGGSAGGGQGSQAATVPGGAGGAFGGGGGAGGTDSTTAYAGGQGGQGGIVLAYFPTSFGSVTGSLITNAAPATASLLSAPPITAYLSQTTVSATLTSSAVIATTTASLNATAAAATISSTANVLVSGNLAQYTASSILVSGGTGVSPPPPGSPPPPPAPPPPPPFAGNLTAFLRPLPAVVPTTLTQTIPAYIYAQYSDDEDIQALFTAYNTATQEFVDWFNTIQLPVYTGSQIAGPLLDWVAEGLYGISRPQLVSGSISSVGPLNTWALNTLALNTFKVTGQINRFTVNDDIFKRIITWHFFKGDGQQFCTEWLKRRVMRFLVGRNGVAPNIDNTYPVSVAFNGNGSVTVNVSVDGIQVTSDVAQIFQAGVSSGKLALPFQLSTIVKTNQMTTGLANDGGVLQVTAATGWPTSPTNLAPGALWDNGGIVSVVTGYTVSGAPLFYGSVTATQLLADGGKSLPTSNPNITGELWNDNGVVSVS